MCVLMSGSDKLLEHLALECLCVCVCVCVCSMWCVDKETVMT